MPPTTSNKRPKKTNEERFDEAYQLQTQVQMNRLKMLQQIAGDRLAHPQLRQYAFHAADALGSRLEQQHAAYAQRAARRARIVSDVGELRDLRAWQQYDRQLAKSVGYQGSITPQPELDRLDHLNRIYGNPPTHTLEAVSGPTNSPPPVVGENGPQRLTAVIRALSSSPSAAATPPPPAPMPADAPVADQPPQPVPDDSTAQS